MRLILFLIGALFLNIAFAGTRDPNTNDSQYIEYGKKFHCVLRILGVDKKGQQYYASCVAIRNNRILTAAHVVKDCESCFVVIDDKKYCVNTVIYPEQYEENKFGYNDVAIGYIDSDLKLDFYPELYSNTDEVGKICSISGFGMVGTFKTGIKESDNQRRAGSNKIESLDRHLLVCTPSILNRTQLEFLIGSGDSGGGLFIDQKLAGINSCVMATDGKPDSTYRDESGHTRISEYRQWILDNLDRSADEKKE